MSNGENELAGKFREQFANDRIKFSEKEVQDGTRFEVGAARKKAIVTVNQTGSVVVQGADSKEKNYCEELRNEIVNLTFALKRALSPEIEKLPETLQEKVPITLIAIFKFPIIWPNPFLVPVAMLFGYVLFYRLRRLGALRERLKIQALGLEEA